tara:strand:+ start:2508 stop:3383 length:876 start_codon:yes stop_codon:yes gene_type:complete
MTRIAEPLNEDMQMELNEGDVLVDLHEELDRKPEADVSQETTEEEVALVETEVEPEELVAEEEEPKTPPLNGKYSGKSIEDVVQMHQEAERLVGRQGAEVGELRKIVDEFIKNKVSDTTSNKVSKEQSEADFFDNPNESVAKAIADSPEMRQMKDIIARQNEQEVLSKLATKHPDYMDVVQNHDFGEWVKGSKVRLELLQRADKYDFNAADELLSFWKERKDMVKATAAVNSEDRKQQRKAASTGGKGSGEPISRKIYKRSDIVNLMTKDPDKYMANITEIQRAYEEGRVK